MSADREPPPGLPRTGPPRVDLPRVDLHSHAGRCFLAGLQAGHPVTAALGAASVTDAVRAAQGAGMTALCLSAVADFVLLRPDSATGLRAHRDFSPGEAYADYQRQLAGIREAVAEAGAELATSAADLDRAADGGRTAVLLGCEGGDFLEGELRRLGEARAAGLTMLTLVHYRVNEIGDVQTEAPVHDGLSRFGRDVVAECNRLGIVVDCAHASFATTMAALEASSQPVIISHAQLGYPGSTHPRLMTARHAAAVAEAGGLIGAWPCGITSRSLADFGTEIIRLTEGAGPGRVAIGTDLDGNYRPVLTSYDQLDDLASVLRDRGLASTDIDQIRGGNALNLLNRVLGQPPIDRPERATLRCRSEARPAGPGPGRRRRRRRRWLQHRVPPGQTRLDRRGAAGTQAADLRHHLARSRPDHPGQADLRHPGDRPPEPAGVRLAAGGDRVIMAASSSAVASADSSTQNISRYLMAVPMLPPARVTPPP